jgi:hypothetical protein
MAEEEASEHWWRRVTFGIGVTLLLVLWTFIEWLHFVHEHYEDAIDGIVVALRHVDLVAAIDGFVVGMIAVPFGAQGLWTPLFQFFAGLHGLWTMMLSGGWTAVVAGVSAVLAGIALLAFAGIGLDDKRERPAWVRVPAGAFALGFGAVVVFAAGLSVIAFTAPLTERVPQLAVLSGGFDDLSAGFAASRAAVAAPDEGASVAPFARRFAATHLPFIALTVAIGVAGVVLLVMLAQSMDAGVLLLVLVPPTAVAVLVAGAAVAYMVDHLLLVGLILALIKVATISLPTVVGVGIVTLDKGKLFGELFEAVRELGGRIK